MEKKPDRQELERLGYKFHLQENLHIWIVMFKGMALNIPDGDDRHLAKCMEHAYVDWVRRRVEGEDTKRVTASAGQKVTLPPSPSVGEITTIVNNSAENIEVFPNHNIIKPGKVAVFMYIPPKGWCVAASDK